ncbi:hypothetical protein GLR48_21120 [Loktanella sp. M215]|nr:hypothetical protein [Loktanella sp. M215]
MTATFRLQLRDRVTAVAQDHLQHLVPNGIRDLYLSPIFRRKQDRRMAMP